MFGVNGYDPAYAGRAQFGKRNTIWLFGPATTTRKTNIAKAISHAVLFYGCVNWTNENFPFNDCINKMSLWWEERKMTAKVVESAKAILNGSPVCIDQKCQSSQQTDLTPVTVTSNTNMCAVVDGNSITFEHQQPLEDQIFKSELACQLHHDFRKIMKTEIREFFAWAKANECDIMWEFYVQRVKISPFCREYKPVKMPSNVI